MSNALYIFFRHISLRYLEATKEFFEEKEEVKPLKWFIL